MQSSVFDLGFLMCDLRLALLLISAFSASRFYVWLLMFDLCSVLVFLVRIFLILGFNV